MEAGAIREEGGAIYVRVQVRPGARESRIRETDMSGRGLVRIDVAAPPEAGAANRALCTFLERRLGKPVHVRVVRGLTSRRKTLRIEGASRDRVASALIEELS